MQEHETIVGKLRLRARIAKSSTAARAALSHGTGAKRSIKTRIAYAKLAYRTISITD